MKYHSDLKIGDSVVVKPGVKDDDTGGDLGGWQGRINGFGENEDGSPTVCIAWDSLTLRSMPRAVLEHSEVEGCDWRTYYLLPSEVEAATARDTEEDVEAALDELESQTDWLHLGEEGRRIQAVLNGIDRDDEIALVEAWEANLEQKLTFPFEAEIKEGDHFGRVRVGDRVNLTSVYGANDHYGILVNIRHGREDCVLPLCDLEATDKRSANYLPLRDYVVWFANR